MSTKPVAVMVCGISGSGKTSLSKLLESEGYKRLSVDEEMQNEKSLSEEKSVLRKKAIERIKIQLSEIIANGKNAVLDISFCHKSQRDEFKAFIEENGGTWKLFYLKADLETLRMRLSERTKTDDSNAIPVSEKELLGFWERFEVPSGEGEIIINSEKPFDLGKIQKYLMDF